MTVNTFIGYRACRGLLKDNQWIEKSDEETQAIRFKKKTVIKKRKWTVYQVESSKQMFKQKNEEKWTGYYAKSP